MTIFDGTIEGTGMRFGGLVWVAVGLLFWPSVQKEERKPAPSRGKTDAAIIDAVMIDIPSAKDSPWEHYHGDGPKPEVSKRTIRLEIEPMLPRRSEDELLEQYAKDEWARLTNDEMAAAKEAAADLVARNAEKESSPRAHRPKDKRIILVSHKEGRGVPKVEHWVDGPQVFHASAPGYSKDGKTACVYLSYPWSGGFHGGVGTYVLALRKDKWVVLVRQFIRYV